MLRDSYSTFMMIFKDTPRLVLALVTCLFVVSASFSVSAPAFAAEGDQPAAEQVKPKDVQKLVNTLENDKSRQQLIDNLKLLVEAQKKEEKKDSIIEEPITEALGVRSAFNKIGDEYEAFLKRNELSSSLVHQGIGTSIVLLVALGFWFGVRKLSKKILRLFEKLSEKVGVTFSRFGTYTNVLQAILKVMVLGLSIYTLGKIWDISAIGKVFESTWMQALLGTAATVILVAFFAALVWEGIGIYLSFMLQKAENHNQTRVRTLLPIVKNIVLGVFAVLFGLVLMSEIGINVTPLLAGAGVIGVAIGFGAQTMVKDFLTGFTIVLEDLVRVGDVATVGGSTGVVEKITLRKIQLRDVAGIVYTIPFSEITTIQNLTKDYSFYVMDIGISYNADTDKVIEVLHQVDEELRADSEYSSLILAPLEVLGVDQFADSAVVIKARIKTIPIKQWTVGREFNRRMKYAFDNAGIEIPFPQRVVTMLPPDQVTEQPSPEAKSA